MPDEELSSQGSTAPQHDPIVNESRGKIAAAPGSQTQPPSVPLLSPRAGVILWIASMILPFPMSYVQADHAFHNAVDPMAQQVGWIGIVFMCFCFAALGLHHCGFSLAERIFLGILTLFVQGFVVMAGAIFNITQTGFLVGP